MGNFTNSFSRQQEEFSIAWLYAVASVAGYSVQHIRVDNDSVDAEIRQKGNGDECPEFELINIQLKCTYSHIPKKDKINYPLSIKNYDDLRGIKRLNPRILVVLHVPSELKEWLTHQEDKIILQHCAYWTSLRGEPKKDNKKSVTICVPTSQKFTVDELKRMMNLAAEGKRPEELLS